MLILMIHELLWNFLNIYTRKKSVKNATLKKIVNDDFMKILAHLPLEIVTYNCMLNGKIPRVFPLR